MATLNSNQLKVGVIFCDGGSTYLVLKYSHIKKARGQAVIKVKVKDLHTGSITELSYTNEQKVQAADVEKRSVQYLYEDGNAVYFMNIKDYAQFPIDRINVEEDLKFMKEGQKVVAMFLGGEPIGVEVPKSVELKITDTSPAVAGNTATGAMKDAIVETGYRIQVPLFINKGDVVKINTESGNYVGRV